MRVAKKFTVGMLFVIAACDSAWYLGTGQAADAGNASAAAKTEEVTVPGRVSDVILYRGQALVTRSIPVDGAKGDQVIVVSDLPEQVVAGSLFAEGTESAQIRAVRYRTRAVEDNPNPEIRELDKAIEELNDAVESNRKALEVLAKRSQYLDQLDSGFIQPAIKTDLSHGVLDAKAVETVSAFSFKQRKLISDESLDLEKKNKEIGRNLATQIANRAKLTRSTTRTVREALLFVEKKKPGSQAVRLNYLVSRCGWSPAYTFRAGKDRKEVAFEYDALIQQMSGEPWEGVKLTLSTASPTLSAAGPGLGPFTIVLTAGAPMAQNMQGDLAAQLKSIAGRQEEALAKTQNAYSLAEQIGSSWSANSAANEFQSLELTSRIEAWYSLKPSDVNIGEGTSMSYPALPDVNLASRSDQQIVRILDGKLKSKFYNVATPVLTSFVYREAELTNTSPEDLLAGASTVYLDGRFVGRGEIPTVGSGQPFVVGFGVDPQVRAYRALISRDEKTQGANRELKLKYELTVENFKEEPVSLRLYDRYPYYSTNETDVRVTLEEPKDNQLSQDEAYKTSERRKNILRWDIDVPAKTTAEKAKKIDYVFKVEFPQTRMLSAVGAFPGASPVAPTDLQQEFEQLQRARQGGGGFGGGGFGGGRGGAFGNGAR